MSAYRKPNAHEILIPRRFDNGALIVGWASNLGYSYFMNDVGEIVYISKNSSILRVEVTDFTIEDYPALMER